MVDFPDDRISATFAFLQASKGLMSWRGKREEIRMASLDVNPSEDPSLDVFPLVHDIMIKGK